MDEHNDNGAAASALWQKLYVAVSHAKSDLFIHVRSGGEHDIRTACALMPPVDMQLCDYKNGMSNLSSHEFDRQIAEVEHSLSEFASVFESRWQ